MKKQINEIHRMQQLAGLLKENEQPSTKDLIDAVLALAANNNPKLNTYIQPVKFMLDQAFAEDVNILTIEEEAKQEMEFQLKRANNFQLGNNTDQYKNLRPIFAKIEAILSNAL
jgi:hypothetical protein